MTEDDVVCRCGINNGNAMVVPSYTYPMARPPFLCVTRKTGQTVIYSNVCCVLLQAVPCTCFIPWFIFYVGLCLLCCVDSAILLAFSTHGIYGAVLYRIYCQEELAIRVYGPAAQLSSNWERSPSAMATHLAEWPSSTLQCIPRHMFRVSRLTLPAHPAHHHHAHCVTHPSSPS